MNHVDEEHKTTDIYIEKDWGTVDFVQSAVIKYLKDLKAELDQIKTKEKKVRARKNYG